MRWGIVGDSPVPWLAAAAAVVLMAALGWLATEDQPTMSGPVPTVEVRQAR